MNKDLEYMRIALDEARLAMESGEVPVGAVLIDDEGGVVIRAHNLREAESDATAHDARAGAVESIFNIPGHPSLAPAPIITAGIMEDECKALLRNFFAARR